MKLNIARRYIYLPYDSAVQTFRTKAVIPNIPIKHAVTLWSTTDSTFTPEVQNLPHLTQRNTSPHQLIYRVVAPCTHALLDWEDALEGCLGYDLQERRVFRDMAAARGIVLTDNYVGFSHFPLAAIDKWDGEQWLRKFTVDTTATGEYA